MLQIVSSQLPLVLGAMTSFISDSVGYLFNHESGLEDDTSAMTSFIQSADFDLGDGDQFSMTRRIIPDVEFTGSTSNTPEIDMELQTRNFPGGALNTDASDRQRVVKSIVGTYTDQVFVRASIDMGTNTCVEDRAQILPVYNGNLGLLTVRCKIGW